MRSSRLFALSVVFMAIHCLSACAQSKPIAAKEKETKEDQKESISADEQEVRQAVTKFVELYNEHNAKGLADLYAEDARVVFRDGTEVDGRKEIARSFEEAFAETPTSAISVVVESIRFLTSEVAVEEGFSSDFPDGETQAARSRYTVVHLKKDGQWTMQSTRIEEEESLSAYRDLQALEWLVGDWIDEGRTENVESSYRWDEGKSFLLEEFKVIRQGVVVLKGTQRIGWDPQAKQIRSWVFDSAGGFGEATWAQVDEAWVCKAKGVSADGATTSATRILDRAADNRVIWTSQDRIAGSDALPDITITMVRKSPEPK
jgi:uncharacterized protein (TIGR02246 family)